MSAHAGAFRARDGVRLGRFLPLSLAVTAAVTVLPLLLVAQLGPARDAVTVALHVVAAVALSVVIARVLAALWTRHEQSSDLVFGDLLLWGWLRRAIAERRLDAATREIQAPTPLNEERAALLRRLSTLLEARQPYTHGHSRRVARHAERIARELGLPGDRVARIRAAALVHDIGKINVPRPVLTKPGKLTDAEFALVKRHAVDGAAMVNALGDSELTAIVRHHHERIDGSGYPDGLAGDDIPIGSRVIAVADTFDAITSSRAYRGARTHKQALGILSREAGAQLDAEAVAAFVSYYSARRSVGFATVIAAAPQRLLSGLGGFQSGVAAGVAPIAQAACGVGGIALIGACFAAPATQDAQTSVDREHAKPHRSARAKTLADASQPAATTPAVRPRTEQRRRTARDDRDRTPDAIKATPAPRSLKAPPGDGPRTTAGAVEGAAGPVADSVDRALPDPPETPALQLPDVQTVLDPVTDIAPLPHADVPAPLPRGGPLPQVGLP